MTTDRRPLYPRYLQGSTTKKECQLLLSLTLDNAWPLTETTLQASVNRRRLRQVKDIGDLPQGLIATPRVSNRRCAVF